MKDDLSNSITSLLFLVDTFYFQYHCGDLLRILQLVMCRRGLYSGDFLSVMSPLRFSTHCQRFTFRNCPACLLVHVPSHIHQTDCSTIVGHDTRGRLPTGKRPTRRPLSVCPSLPTVSFFLSLPSALRSNEGYHVTAALTARPLMISCLIYIR